MMERFGSGATRLPSELLSGYAPVLQRASTSFRPAEIAGREYSQRHDEKLLHVDAFSSRPTHGRRIFAPVFQHRAGRCGAGMARGRAVCPLRAQIPAASAWRAAGKCVAAGALRRDEGASQRIRPGHVASA